MRKKLLFLLSSLKFGGAEKHTISLINCLDMRKFEIGLCYFEKKEELINDLRIGRLSLFYCCNKKNKIDFKVLSRLRNQIDLFKPDALICIDPYPGLYAYLLRIGKQSAFKIVQILHQTIMPALYNEMIVKLLYRRMINNSDGVIFVCRNQMNYWIKRYHIKKRLSSYIHNGVETGFFSPDCVSESCRRQIKNQYNLNENDYIIGICAVLRPEKKHTDLLKALRRTIDLEKSVKLVIIGDGPERKEIEHEIDRLRLTDAVLMTGFQADVRPYLAICDLVVITSVAVETFSIAVIESMSMGKPIIASDIGGASEQIIEGQNGFLYPAGNIDILTEKLLMALDKNLLLKMGAESRRVSDNWFSLQKMIHAYNHILFSLG